MAKLLFMAFDFIVSKFCSNLMSFWILDIQVLDRCVWLCQWRQLSFLLHLWSTWKWRTCLPMWVFLCWIIRHKISLRWKNTFVIIEDQHSTFENRGITNLYLLVYRLFSWFGILISCHQDGIIFYDFRKKLTMVTLRQICHCLENIWQYREWENWWEA